MVSKGQGAPPFAPMLMNPKSRLGIRLLHAALGLASRPAIRTRAARLFANDPQEPDLSLHPPPSDPAPRAAPL